MLAETELRDAVLLVFANKQDLPRAMSVQEVTSKMALHEIKNRHWYIHGLCATSGDGLYEGLDWLSRTLEANTDRASGCELRRAAHQGDVVALAKLLAPAWRSPPVDAQDQFGRTALFVAAQRNRRDCLQLLMEAKADPNKPNHSSVGPLAAAACAESVECVEALLSHPRTDVDRCVRDSTGFAPACVRLLAAKVLKQVLRDVLLSELLLVTSGYL